MFESAGQKETITIVSRLAMTVALLLIILAGFYNYLLFHSLIELSSVIIAFMVFVIALNYRKFIYGKPNVVLFLGIPYGIVGVFDLLHTLSYKGMGVFPGISANLPTELWIIARYLESTALLISCILINKQIKTKKILVLYIMVSLFLFAAVFVFDIFPDCYIEGYGLTDFKKISEFMISIILCAAICMLFKRRKYLEKKTYAYLVISILFTILSEVCFIFYIDVYGFSNFLGHVFKVISFYLIYKATVKVNLLNPLIELRRSEQKYADLVESLPESILIFTDNQFVFANHSAVKLFGEEKFEENAIKFLSDSTRGTDERCKVFEKELICKDGSVAFIEAKMLPYHHQGEQSVIAILYNMTDRRRLEIESLQEKITMMKYQKEYIDILYETTGKILSSATPQEDIHNLCCKVMRFLNCHAFFNYLLEGGETVMHLNACEGITAEQQKIIEYLPLGDAICGCAARDKCRIVAENIQTTQDPRTKLIKTLGIRAYACHPLIVNSEVIGTLAFGTKSRDYFCDEELLLMKTVAESVSVAIKRKRNEEILIKQANELKIADENKNEFISALSHELRNPLAAVVAGLSLTRLTDDKLKIEQTKNIMQRQIDQLCRLVDDLLDLTRITNNKIVLKKQRIDIISLTSIIANDQYLLFDEKGVKLKVHLSRKPIYLDADPVRIKQIIGNLLQNSVKFTDRGGHVIVKVNGDGEYAIISIKDNGIGIKPEFLPNLFEPFKQANTSIERSDGGLGLGLSIVKEIAEMHGGSVRAHSDGAGKGSEFTILLPITKQKWEESLS